MSGLVPFNRNRSMLRPGGFEDFYNMIDDFFNDNKWPRNLMHDSFKIDVKENESDYLIEAELPGVKKEEMNLELNEDILTISVRREEKTEEKKENYIHRERRFGSMQRSIRLADIKSEGINATFEDGVLRVTVPKEVQPVRKTQIEIK